MSKQSQPTSSSSKPVDSPAAWFAMLEIARNRGDREGELRALSELARLGVTVTFAEAGR